MHVLIEVGAAALLGDLQALAIDRRPTIGGELDLIQTRIFEQLAQRQITKQRRPRPVLFEMAEHVSKRPFGVTAKDGQHGATLGFAEQGFEVGRHCDRALVAGLATVPNFCAPSPSPLLRRRISRRLASRANEPSQFPMRPTATGSHGADLDVLPLGQVAGAAVSQVTLDDPAKATVELGDPLLEQLEVGESIEPRAEIRRRRALVVGEHGRQPVSSALLPKCLANLGAGDRPDPVAERLAVADLELGQLAVDDHERDLCEVPGIILAEPRTKERDEIGGEPPTELGPGSRIAANRSEHQIVELHERQDSGFQSATTVPTTTFGE